MMMERGAGIAARLFLLVRNQPRMGISGIGKELVEEAPKRSNRSTSIRTYQNPSPPEPLIMEQRREGGMQPRDEVIKCVLDTGEGSQTVEMLH